MLPCIVYNIVLQCSEAMLHITMKLIERTRGTQQKNWLKIPQFSRPTKDNVLQSTQILQFKEDLMNNEGHRDIRNGFRFQA